MGHYLKWPWIFWSRPAEGAVILWMSCGGMQDDNLPQHRCLEQQLLKLWCDIYYSFQEYSFFCTRMTLLVKFFVYNVDFVNKYYNQNPAYTHRILFALTAWILAELMVHYTRNDPRNLRTIIIVTSQWASWRLKSQASSLFSQSFVQTRIKNIKALCHWPLWRYSTGHRGITLTKGL